MGDQHAARRPLGEATGRVNNNQQRQSDVRTKRRSSLPHHESLRPDGLLQIYGPHPTPALDQEEQQRVRRTGSPVNPRLSAISKGTESNRNSQISTVSTNASDGKKIKGCIGPWQLGMTLGKGATARVRKARHKFTGQEAAVKIVQKANAKISQAGSLAALDKAESKLRNSEDGVRRMPVGIEREVAIMKLIQHPHIVKLLDIWENRHEIYLVLELVDGGELFEYIVARGRLEEEEAIRFFRQMLSAVGYCHSFKICHRDLKTENVLVTGDGDIRIADFGMAALHQSPDHRLETSCGSPHYAAPELIKGKRYQGEKVDIWSMGVILFAALAGRLPFDVDGHGKDWLPLLLDKIKAGDYVLTDDLSPEAKSLISRILQVDPRQRADLQQIWKHPLIRRYNYLDDFGASYELQSLQVKTCGRLVYRRNDIDAELLRQLRSMWHKLSEESLIKALLSDEPNDQKVFYSLLLRFRDAQLENYIPDLEYSKSDYHHVRPKLSKTYSTSQFTRPNSRGHSRQVSRFTVISNAAETVQSYDPYRASRPQHLPSMRPPEQAKITIHRTRPSNEGVPQVQTLSSARQTSTKSRQASNTGSLSVQTRGRQPRANSRGLVSRNSMASSSRSRNSTSQVRVSAGYKRGVSFHYLRERSLSSQRQHTPTNSRQGIGGYGKRHSNYTDVTDDGGGGHLRPVDTTPPSTRYIRSKKSHNDATPTGRHGAPRGARSSLIWHDDVRQLSSDLAKDCDEAFNKSLIGSNGGSEESTVARHKKGRRLSRPLPPPPPDRAESIRRELEEARRQVEIRKQYGDESPGYLDRMVSHIDRLMPPSPLHVRRDRRVTSAPTDGHPGGYVRPLPSINEQQEGSPKGRTEYENYTKYHSRGDAQTNRTASAPEPGAYPHDTIRVVHPSTPLSPVRMPAPLTIRKKTSQSGQSTRGGNQAPESYAQALRIRTSGLDLRHQYHHNRPDGSPDLGRIDEDHHDDISSAGTVVKKASQWFKRGSKSGDDFKSGPGSSTHATSSDATVVPPYSNDPTLVSPPKKKKGIIGRIFGKKSSKPDMSLSGTEVYEDYDARDSVSAFTNIGHYDEGPRQIEPQQNWFAKLFRVKPACKFICFKVPKRRARMELVTLLREWKRYGIRDIHVDKRRNIVFGRVGAKNFLDLKEVAFAAEIMTVIEHGKKSHLCIARITQERGAASSFHKVVETIETVCKVKQLLVEDERKKRMMIKTLNSA